MRTAHQIHSTYCRCGGANMEDVKVALAEQPVLIARPPFDDDDEDDDEDEDDWCDVCKGPCQGH